MKTSTMPHTQAQSHESAPAHKSVHVKEKNTKPTQLMKTKMRGWIHAGTAPLALANAIVLVCLAPGAALKWACAVYLACGLILFGVSATYHLGKWKPAVFRALRRMDHSNIFLLIAGTYTPLSVALLDEKTCTLVLCIVWIGALAGIIMQVAWITAPRFLSVACYVLLGWVAIWFLPEYWISGGPAIVWLLIAGGICYTVGAAFYATKKPNPWPRYFGFHEFFHTGTVLGYACHAVAIWLAVMA